MDLQLTGTTALVTGSTRGIGYAIALALAGEGADVVVTGRTPATVDAAVAHLRAQVSTTVTGVAADLADPGDVEQLCSQVGDVDVLVNNAGLFEVARFEDITDADWQRFVEVNLLGGARLARRLLPGMLARGRGRIVFVGTESAVDVPADMVHYGATKAAALALANGLAKTTRGTRVTVNSVLGGPTWSDGVAEAVTAIAAAQSLPVERVKEAVIAGRPTSLLGRFIEPEEIAATVAFLASPRASATNGSAVRVDGGVLPTVL